MPKKDKTKIHESLREVEDDLNDTASDDDLMQSQKNLADMLTGIEGSGRYFEAAILSNGIGQGFAAIMLQRQLSLLNANLSRIADALETEHIGMHASHLPSKL